MDSDRWALSRVAWTCDQNDGIVHKWSLVQRELLECDWLIDLDGTNHRPSKPYIVHTYSHVMTFALRLYSAIRYTAYSSKRLISTMKNPEIVLPHQEIDQLWFGGLNLQTGQPPSRDAVKRWFRKDTTFDTNCRYNFPFHAC